MRAKNDLDFGVHFARWYFRASFDNSGQQKIFMSPAAILVVGQKHFERRFSSKKRPIAWA
jgi:hypothetical protein